MILPIYMLCQAVSYWYKDTFALSTGKLLLRKPVGRIIDNLDGHSCEKACLRGFGPTQTMLTAATEASLKFWIIGLV